MSYEATKKSVRLTADTVRICAGMTRDGNLNFSGSINSVFSRYEFLINELKPEFTKNEWLALCQCYNGRFVKDVSESIRRMHWDVDQALQYDGNVLHLLGIAVDDVDSRIAFSKRVSDLSAGQKLAVLHEVEKFWSQGQKGDVGTAV